MTTPLAPSAAPLRQRTGFGVILNLIGLVAVLSYLIPAVGRGAPAIPALTLPLSMLALVAWLASMLLPLERTALLRLCGLLMVLGGAGAAWDTDGVLVVPVIIGVMQLASWDTRPWIAVAA
ncbi:MAG: hypothetical protein J0H64_02895, partial [Actinobacteria bacterium]|nr:hypothetical protein [Actinomycetota bacterium]